MPTQGSEPDLVLQPVAAREVVARFDGGTRTSDGGGLLLRQAERLTGALRQFAACFTDHRDPNTLEPTVLELVRQRVYGLALGYEDLNDHDTLRHDPLLATLVGKTDPTGQDRLRVQDRGKPLAGKSPLHLLELTPPDASAARRSPKIVAGPEAIARRFGDLFLRAPRAAPAQRVLDLDATAAPLHGHQEGRFFHGSYKEFCYLPLYIFCGEHLRAAPLRTADHDASWGAREELHRIVAPLRAAWPTVRLLVRADAGCCREELLSWCEAHGVAYLFGLAQNSRVVEAIQSPLADAHVRYLQTGVAARGFADFVDQTRDSCSRPRRVVGKAEYLPKGPNPRFVVTSLAAAAREARALYEADYGARGEMENRIQEQQLMRFADRTSTAWLRSHQLRLWFSARADVLVQTVRRRGLAGTQRAQAPCGSIRRWLLKIGALVRVTVRKVWVSLPRACPYRAVFVRTWENLRGAQPEVVGPLRC